MKPQTPAGPRFTPRPLPSDDIAEYLTQGVINASWKLRARVRVHMSAEKLSEKIGPWVGTVEAGTKRTSILSTGADNIDSLAAHLTLLQADFEVIEPPELRDALKKLSDRLEKAAVR